MKKFLFSNPLHKLAAVVIAVLLWQMVQLVESPSATRSFDNVPIEYVNLPEDLVIINPPSGVRVDALVTGADFIQVTPQDFKVRMDLKSARPGRNTVTVQVIASPQIKPFVNLVPKPDRFVLDLERIVSKTLKLSEEELQFTGTKAGYKLVSYTLQPDSVTITGPERDVGAAAIARITVDLRDVEPGGVYERTVEVLDQTRRPVARLTVNPQKVLFRPSLEALAPTKNLLITPIWRGSPKFGYRVQDYVVTPNWITVTGDAEVLATISTVETEPIDISGLDSDKDFPAVLKLPASIRTQSAQQVVVRVRVVAQPQPPPTG